MAIKYGDNIKQDGKSIYVGTIPVVSVFKDVLVGRKVVKWWQGTDALTMVKFPPGKSRFMIVLHRIKMKFLAPFISENWYVSSRLYELYPQKNAKIKYLKNSVLRS